MCMNLGWSESADNSCSESQQLQSSRVVGPEARRLPWCGRRKGAQRAENWKEESLKKHCTAVRGNKIPVFWLIIGQWNLCDGGGGCA